MATVFVGLGFVPVRGRIVVQTSERPTIQALPLGDYAAPPRAVDDLDVTITTVTDGIAEVVLPEFPRGRRLTLDQVTDSSGFANWPSGPDRVQATTAGAYLNIRGGFGYLDLYLNRYPGGATVRIDVNEASEVVDLRSETPGLIVVRILGRFENRIAESRFGWHGHEISFEGHPIDSPTVTLGQIPIEAEVRETESTTTLRVTRGEFIAALADGGVREGKILLTAGALLLLFYLVGAMLEGLLRVPRHPMLGVSLARRLGAGLAVPLLVLGGANYFVGAKVAVLIVALLAGGGTILAFVTKRLRLADLSPPASRGYATAFVVLLAVFIPIVLSRGMNVGMLHDDLLWYGAPIDTFWSQSAISSGSDFGNGLRLFDYTARTAVHGTSGLDFFDSTQALRLAFIVVAALSIDEIARLLRLRPTLRTLVVLGGSLSAPLLALWVESYLSREFMASLLPVGLAVLAASFASERPSRSELALAGAVMAAPAAIVPNFATIVPVGFVVLVGPRLLLRPKTLWRDHRHELSAGLAYLAGLLVFLLPNLLWVRDTDVTNENAKFANPIGKEIVIPFYDTAAYPAGLFGGIPFHAHQSHFLGDATGNWVPSALVQVRDAIDGPEALRNFVAAIGVFLVIALCAAIAVLRRQQDRATRAAIALVVGTLVFTIVGFIPYLALWKSQAYLVLMYPFTLAPLVLLTLLLTAAVGVERASRRRTRGVLLAGLIALIAVNFSSASIEASRWMDGPNFPLAPITHYDMATDVIQFEAFLEGRTSTGVASAIIEIPLSEGTFNSDQRWLSNEVVQHLRQHGITCDNCTYSRRLGLLEVHESELGPAPDRLVVIVGARSCDAGTPVLRTPSIVACLG